SYQKFIETSSTAFRQCAATIALSGFPPMKKPGSILPNLSVKEHRLQNMHKTLLKEPCSRDSEQHRGSAKRQPTRNLGLSSVISLGLALRAKGGFAAPSSGNACPIDPYYEVRRRPEERRQLSK